MQKHGGSSGRCETNIAEDGSVQGYTPTYSKALMSNLQIVHLFLVTHVNQIVIGGILWCVEGLRLLGPAGGPRHFLVA